MRTTPTPWLRFLRPRAAPADHPLIVHVADAQGHPQGPSAAMAHYAQAVPVFAQQLIEAFWPGPLTLILPCRPGIAQAATGGQATIGLRCPAHPVAQALLAGLPAAPAAHLGPGRAQRDKLAASAPPRRRMWPANLALMCWCWTAVPVRLALNRPSSTAPGRARAAAPRGDYARRYCAGVRPTTTIERRAVCAYPTRLRHPFGPLCPECQSALDGHRATAQRPAAAGARGPGLGGVPPQPADQPGAGIALRAMPHNALAAAQQLFSDLRDLDALGVPLIWVEAPPESADWEGVRDRLERAAAAG